MLKKIILIISILLFVSACGAAPADNRTIDDFKVAYEAAGYEMDKPGEPVYTLIGAIGGTVFYVDGDKVAIYMYKDAAAIKSAVKNYPLIEGWPENGKFILESSNNRAIDFFMAIK